jgi:riboflavin synthase
MFTGIIECTGIIKKIESSGTNRSFWISSPISNELSADQSVAHDGICLTVEVVEKGLHKVTAVAETIEKTNIQQWKENMSVNIERCMTLGGRLDGHIVQGHVDGTGVCIQKEEKSGSWEYRFRFSEQFASLIVEKGSICVNGISLTAFDINSTEFSVAIIPYTYTHTTLSMVVPESIVNLEFDIVGKYILRNTQIQQKA